MVVVCFERALGGHWYRLSLQVKEMALRKVGGLAFWDFIDFIVRTRIPIFVLLRPFIQCKVRPHTLSHIPVSRPVSHSSVSHPVSHPCVAPCLTPLCLTPRGLTPCLAPCLTPVYL